MIHDEMTLPLRDMNDVMTTRPVMSRSAVIDAKRGNFVIACKFQARR